MKEKFDDLQNQMEKFQSLPKSKQAEIFDLLKQANLNIDEIKSNL